MIFFKFCFADGARNFYASVQSATSASSFDTLAKKYGTTSFLASPIPATKYLKTSIYKVKYCDLFSRK